MSTQCQSDMTNSPMASYQCHTPHYKPDQPLPVDRMVADDASCLRIAALVGLSDCYSLPASLTCTPKKHMTIELRDPSKPSGSYGPD